MGFLFSFFIFAFTLFFLFFPHSFSIFYSFLISICLRLKWWKRKKLDFGTVASYLKRLRWMLFTCLQSWINISFLTNNLLINSWLHFFFCYHLPIFPQYPTSFILIFLNPFITHFAPFTFLFYFIPFSICWLIIFHSKALIDRFIRKLNIFKWGVFIHHQPYIMTLNADTFQMKYPHQFWFSSFLSIVLLLETFIVMPL